MTTAEAIEGITDAGRFERLATQALRHLDEDSRLIEHAGVNAQGKTIANPVDGFYRVPNSAPPRFVMHQFATTSRDKLERKWLHRPAKDGDEAGDLIKASQLAGKLWGQFPGAQCVVWLCSNQRLDPEFMAQVYADGERLSIEVRLLGQSNLRDWLDQNPEGQWLRQALLGIAAERLSPSWLCELALANLKNYAGEFPLVAPMDFIATRAGTQLVEQVMDGAEQLLLLIGRSGAGKSVACYQLLQHCGANGRPALWLPADVAERAHTMTEAIGILLRGMAPGLEAGAGETAMQMFSVEKPLVVVVDDLNRGMQPAKLLQKLVGWARPRNEEVHGSRYRIVCPVWDQHFAPSRNRLNGVEWLAELALPSFTLDEAEACLRAALGATAGMLATSLCRSVAERLGRDPILLSMYGRRFASKAIDGIVGIEDILGGYVYDACAQLAHSGERLLEEYAQALEALARWMLGSRQYYPKWDELADAGSGLAAHLFALRALVQQGQLCRVANRSGESRFEFRHDRLLAYHLVLALAGYLDEPGRHEAVLTEPYFVGHLGAAFARKSYPEAAMIWLREHAPVALFAAVAEFNGANRDRELAVVATTREWLREALQAYRAPWAQINAAVRFLERAETDDVLTITEDVKDEPGVEVLRLIHGDVSVSFRWIVRRMHAFPSHRVPWLANHVQRAKERHGVAMVATLRRCLLDPKLTGLHLLGAFSLAALLGDHSCAPEVVAAFQREGSRDALTWGFWSVLRCGGEDPERYLAPFIAAWRGLSTEHKPHHGTERQEFGDTFRRLDWSTIAPEIIEHLVACGRADAAMRHEFVWLLHEVDHPVALVFVTEGLAELTGESDKGFHHWEMTFRDVWDATHSRGRKLSAAARAALRQLWESSGSKPAVVRTAMRTWVRAVGNVGELRQVPATHLWYSSALWQRTTQGDRTTIPEAVEAVRQKPHWIRIIHHVWSPAFETVVEEQLMKLHAYTPADYSGGHGDSHYSLSQLLRDIPPAIAEPMLLRHWDFLRYSPLFVQVALYIGTPELVALAAKAIEACPTPNVLFEHCGTLFGFRTTGLTERVDLPLLRRLAPYARHLDDMNLDDFIHTALRLGETEWVQREFREECERREKVRTEDDEKKWRNVRRERFPSDDELIAELDEMAGKKDRAYELPFWFERVEDRVGSRERGWNVCGKWFARGRTAAKWTFVAEGVARLGNRSHLEAFRRWKPEGMTPELSLIEAGVTFDVMRRSPV
ncbi:MAG: ATP-binding protein [Opitutae bacterium]|nr:ATP-binding protein [Opitutae bacterium]